MFPRIAGRRGKSTDDGPNNVLPTFLRVNQCVIWFLDHLTLP